MDLYEFEASLVDRDQGQPGLQREILSQKTMKINYIPSSRKMCSKVTIELREIAQ